MNENFFLWDAMKIAKGVFTPITRVDFIHEASPRATAIRGSMFVMDSNEPIEAFRLTAAPCSLKYAEMVKLAEKTPPPQSWFEENVQGLRRARKSVRPRRRCGSNPVAEYEKAGGR